MDMLEIGRGMSEEEDKTHFGMWCIMSSPLLIGCDLDYHSGDIFEVAEKRGTDSVKSRYFGFASLCR